MVVSVASSTQVRVTEIGLFIRNIMIVGLGGGGIGHLLHTGLGSLK